MTKMRGREMEWQNEKEKHKKYLQAVHAKHDHTDLFEKVHRCIIKKKGRKKCERVNVALFY